MNSVKEYFSALDISIVYSIYILEIVILVKFSSSNLQKLGSNRM